MIESSDTKDSPSIATDILQSLSTKIDVAKDLVWKCRTMDADLKSIIEQLKGVLSNITEDLNLIPSPIFENNCNAEIQVQSLSKEMSNAGSNMIRFLPSDNDQDRIENSSTNKIEEKKDSYQVQTSKMASKELTANYELGEMPRLKDFLKGMYYCSHGSSNPSFKTLSQMAEQIEPLYDTFFCPLTKKIMEDPVIIESGVTYERRAIEEWFENSDNDSKEIRCPITKQKLNGRILNTNIAFQTTIAEWKERNETTRMRLAQTALSSANLVVMVLDAIKDLKDLCTKRMYNKMKMHDVGITKMLAQLLEHDDTNVRCETFSILQLLVEDEYGKEIIAKTRAIAAAIEMLSSKHPQERHASVSLLLELSKSQILCEIIGTTPGGILMLITMKYDTSSDPVDVEKAGAALKNLEKHTENIKCMAENGLLEPLINHMADGDEEMQMEMVCYLGELVLGNNMKSYVAERVSSTLINMIQCGDKPSRKAAFKVLVHISAHQTNTKTLTDTGIVLFIMDELLTMKIQEVTMESKEQSSAVLANLLESGADPRHLQVNKHGHKMDSDYTVHNLARIFNSSNSDELNKNLIRIQLCLTKLPKPLATLVAVLKETEVCYTITEFLNIPNDDLFIVSGKLLITLSTQIGHRIAEVLCKTRGQPESLIKKLPTNRITKRDAISVNLLARLPHRHLLLNLALLHSGTLPIIVDRIRSMNRSEDKPGRHERHFVEGLVGILLRFTSTLSNHEVLQMAREQDLATLFMELLTTAGSDEVQRMAAIGLEKLSLESVKLSKPPLEAGTSSRGKSMLQRKPRKLRLCPVHRGECTPSSTFCLVEVKAVEKLVRCLEHENEKVVEAAIGAISTLVDERVDVERSAEVLGGDGIVEKLVEVMRREQREKVRDKAFTVIERLIMRRGRRNEIYTAGGGPSEENILWNLRRGVNLPRNYTA